MIHMGHRVTVLPSGLMGVRVRQPQAAGALTFICRDVFTTDRTAGNVDGTACEPGPGTRTVNDTTPTLALSGGYVQSAARVGASDPAIRFGSVARATGKAMLAKAVLPASGFFFGGLHPVSFGWGTPAVYWASTSLGVYFGASWPMLAGLTPGTQFWWAAIARTTGTLLAYRNPSDTTWYIGRAEEYTTTDPLYPTAGAWAAAPTGTVSWLKEVRIADLGSPFDDDDGLVTTRLAGSRSPGDTFTHDADAFISFTLTTVPTSGQIEIRFRMQDTSNYWQLTIDSSRNVDLDEVVSGTPTQRHTYASTTETAFTIHLSATAIEVAAGTGITQPFRVSYYSASKFKTETDGELETLGTGGAISDIVSWPKQPDSTAQAELNKWIA